MTSGDKDGKNIETINDMYDIYKNLVDKYNSNSNVDIIRSSTVDFLKSIEDNYIDAIYVDADHSYNAVLNDLTLSFNKLKNGGILAGHDYIENNEVLYAVDDFCKSYNQKIIATTSDGCPSFLIKVSK
jgi:predicted O-methyltransferase YrrM